MRTTKAFTILSLVLICSTPIAAMADHHDGHHYGNSYKNGYKNGYKHGYKYNRYKHGYKNNRYSWNEERGLYRSHWGRVSANQRARYEAQLATQWRAYHHNNWNGRADWNNYSDPAFLDYLHTSNPSLLTSIRTVLGF